MPTRPANEMIVDMLRRRPEEIPPFLNACAEEGQETFLSGLRTAVAALGGNPAMGKNTGLTRQAIQKMLREGANPQLSSLIAVLSKMGLRLGVFPSEPGHLASRHR